MIYIEQLFHVFFSQRVHTCFTCVIYRLCFEVWGKTLCSPDSDFFLSWGGLQQLWVVPVAMGFLWRPGCSHSYPSRAIPRSIFSLQGLVHVRTDAAKQVQHRACCSSPSLWPIHWSFAGRMLSFLPLALLAPAVQSDRAQYRCAVR